MKHIDEDLKIKSKKMKAWVAEGDSRVERMGMNGWEREWRENIFWIVNEGEREFF